MSLLAIRFASRLKPSAICSAIVMKNNTHFFQSSGITSAGGKPRKRVYKPYDYRRKFFTILEQPFDRTLRRLDENSKVIVIDGPMAAGKTEFAKKLAHELDFKFVPPPNINDLYKAGDDGLTYQDLDELLPPEHRIYDLQSFYKDSAPTMAEGNMRAGELQLDFFTARLLTYNDALLHLLSTGQGVVCVRSPWTDRPFAKAMLENGFISRAGFEYYSEEIAKNHLCDYPRPHLVIYLDADVEQTKDNIKRRNNELEMDSKVLTDGYLQSIENEYKDRILPALEEHSELLVYPSIPNITEHEISLMVEDIESLGDLKHSGIADDHHLADWARLRDEELAYKRRDYQNLRLAELVTSHERPYGAPEMLQDEYFIEARNTLYDYQPGWQYETGYDPSLQPWWKIALGMRLLPEKSDQRHFWVPA